MRTFLIHFELPNSPVPDSIVITGETIEEIREKAEKELTARGGQNPRSEEI